MNINRIYLNEFLIIEVGIDSSNHVAASLVKKKPTCRKKITDKHDTTRKEVT